MWLASRKNTGSLEVEVGSRRPQLGCQNNHVICENLKRIESITPDTDCCGFVTGDENQRFEFVKGGQLALHETIVMGFDPQGRYLFIWSDPLLQERYGIDVSHLKGKSLRDVFPRDEAERRIAMTRKIFETGIRHREEYSLDFPNGRFWHDVTLAPMRGTNGETIAVVGIVHDITERRRIKEGLREVDELHRDIVTQVDEAILIHEEGRILFCNPAAVRFFGTTSEDDLIGRSAWEFVHPDGYESVSKFKDMTRDSFSQTRVSQEMSFVTAKGAVAVGQITASWVDYKGNKALLTVIRDVTQEKAAKQRLLRTQKQESLAVLAAGVAHDFNNLLMGIVGNASLIRQDLTEERTREKLDIIERAALRASELTRQLMVFAGDDDLVAENVNLCDLVSEMSELMRVTIPRRVRVEHDFESADLTVFGDPSQLRQVVMNLLVNASEAIGNHDGRIRVRIGCVDADRALLNSAVTMASLPEGQYNFLEVEDDGPGIDAEAISKIFDPFFTTKFTGRGLGLAAVLGIAQAHGGGVQVTSEHGLGAVFRVVLPAAERGGPTRFSSVPAARPSRPGRGRALIADDDSTVRDVLRATLEISGFEVLVAADGEEALGVFEENDDLVVAVIDVTTPYLDGYQVISTIKRRRPELPTILLSGRGAQDSLDGEKEGGGPDRYLGKPFFPKELMAIIDELTSGPDVPVSPPSTEE